ncbi:LCCL domain-containing protein [Plasmodium yoelii]|uniref:LCCL domain-containing protein n=2 Tax=Plasmodium yoelii TaxID=5861 RepID=A0AAF0B6D7_PLAYO|nr:LCCL domain-containing protein [Plasmodium yoelii]WBY58170.1 LCCL domain-containing protein [Plasmodium yoelii yoelii]CDU85206.1 LCCL domain-containing protein [Plasmodium yoelii]VTZ79101.1 LCCL domain-containing protein [Plasmodium yoelii]|eukprot:XP_728507.2 LCCL domain-containing protein [Plasmodium yoelii]
MRIYNWVSCGFIILQFFLNVYGKEWCKAKFEYGMSDYAECQKEGDNLTKYMIEIIPAKANNINLYCDVSIVLSNSQGINTKEINIGSEKEGLFRKIYSVRKDIDNPEYVHVKLDSKINNNRSWKCKKIKIWKDYKYWTFDCIGILNEEKREATYFLSGNKLYTAYVQTGKDIEAGTTGIIDIILLGNNNKRSNTKMLHEGFISGGLKKIKFQASDVGNLENIILINNSYNDPWYCDFIKIKSDDSKIYVFNVKSWIGYPYNNKIKININTNNIDGNAKDIDCHIRANDLIDTTKSLNNNFVLQNKVHIFKVRCPQNCHSSEFSIIEGTSIHPASTSICAAAIYDGSLTESGGEIIVTITKGLNYYYAMDQTYNNLKAIEFSTKGDESDKNNFSFYTYHLTSIDDIKSNIRIVDSFGKLSSLGRLEIRVNNKWGAVCKKGPNFAFSEDAAKRACKDLGFPNGIYIKENCSNINEQNYCAGYKYPFNASGIMCSGNEQNLLSCNTDDPSYCIDHHDDVIIQCINQLGNDSIENGTIRLLDSTGSPTSNGIGRLQIYYNGVFGSICSEGWTKETEKIACLELGYHNVKANGFSQHLCNDIAGENLCGHDTERINATNFRCKGDEPNLKNCPHETSEDIYCSHEEDIIIGCASADEEGNNSISSTNNYKYGLNKHMMSMEKKKFHPKIELSCFDKITSKAELSKGNVGDIFLVSCPEKCDEDIGAIKGTFVYTFDSYICKAAIHAGVLSSNVTDDVVLIITHSRNKFIGTKRNNIESKEFIGESKSFSLSIPTNYIIMEERQNNSKYEDEILKEDNDFYYEHIFKKENNNEQEKNKTFFEHSMHLEPTFQWIAPSSFAGFNGDENQYINANNLPNEKYIRTLSNFTFIIHFIPNNKGKNKWRTILSHSLCEGISISIDEENELIIEQNCNPHLVKTKFIPKFEHPYHLVLIYNKSNKSISLYMNQKKINLENTKFDFTLNGDLTIGRSNKQATDYFIGDINFVKIYKYILTEHEIKESYNSVISNNYLNDGMSGNRDINIKKTQNKKTKNNRKTIDGRDCITPCKSKTNVNKNIQINTEEFYLNCSDNLLSERFNGKIGAQFLASCLEDCTNSKYIVKGSNNYYTPDTSICKAVMHSGIIHKTRNGHKNDENDNNNNSFIIKIVEGLTEYKSSRGHFGIVSKSEKQSQLRSFSLFSKMEDDIFTCFTDAAFLLELPIGTTKNVICPENCHKIDKQIFGTNTYSPLSSVCKAAIHAGVISIKGGHIQIVVGKGQQEFKSSTQNNIQSYIAEKQNRSFTFLKRLY